MSEIGIPFDMDNKKAYTDSDFGNQYAAMDANNFALEGAGLNYTIWCYCSNVFDWVASTNYRIHIDGEIFGMVRIWRFGAKTTRHRVHRVHLTRKSTQA